MWRLKYPQLRHGLVGAWCPSRDRFRGSSILTDQSTAHNNGTLTNMDPATDWIISPGAGGGYALDFDGSNDYVKTSGNVTRDASFTASIWVACDYAGSTTYARFMEHGLNESFTLCLNKAFAANTYTAQYNDADGAWLNSVTSVTADWTHIVLTYNVSQTTGRLYINGVEEDSASKSGTATRTLPMYFGGEATSPALTTLKGKLDDARVYNRCLTPPEITQLYRLGRGGAYALEYDSIGKAGGAAPVTRNDNLLLLGVS